MYFIITKRMLEVCFSIHPNIQHRINLIRNRKGHLPHIVVVTSDPIPNRLASLALGTGDIDCVYHFTLYELICAVKDVGSEDAVELLDTLVSGKRLKLDLAV